MHKAAAGRADGRRLGALVAVIVCAMVFDVTIGLSYPLLALVLEARGVETWVNGLNAAMLPLGLVATAPFVPALAARFGPWRYAVACMAATALLLFLLKLWPALSAWFVLRFLLGAAEGGLFAISETWINELAEKRNRGRVVAGYASLLSLGFATGPFLIPVTGSQGWPPFLVAIAFTLLGLVVMLAARRRIPAPAPERPASLGAFLALAPTLLATALVFGLFDTAVMALLPLYALRHGLGEATASLLLGALIAGNIVLQLPLGWLADRSDRRAVMIACAVLTVLGALLLPAAIDTVWRWPLVIVWGTTGFGIYTLGLAELGDRFAGQQLLAGTVAFTAMFGLGGILGPALGGLAMETLGPEGLPLFIAAAFAALAGLAMARRRRLG